MERCTSKSVINTPPSIKVVRGITLSMQGFGLRVEGQAERGREKGQARGLERGLESSREEKMTPELP